MQPITFYYIDVNIMNVFFIAPKKKNFEHSFPAPKETISNSSLSNSPSDPSSSLSVNCNSVSSATLYLKPENNTNIKPCNKSRCLTCNHDAKPNFRSNVTNKSYNIINHTSDFLTCSSSNIIYLITCSRCGVQYVGETSQRLNLRMNNHRTAINGKKDTILYEHFRQEDGCHITHCIVQPIEKIDDSGSKQDQKKKRLEREAFWIKKLRTLTPYGLNDRLDGKNWRYRWRDDIAGKCFDKIPVHQHGLNSHRGNKPRRNKPRGKQLSKKASFNSTWFLNAIKNSFTNLKNWRNLARIKIYSLKNIELHNFSWTLVNLSNDWHHDYPREIINLILDMVNYRLFLVKKSVTKRNMLNFVKIYFQAKEVEEIRLNSIFRKHMDCIPSSFASNDPPTILYNRTSHIGSTIFNYKDVVDSVLTDDWKEDNLTVCNCSKSAFCDPHHGHVVTGDLKIIENRHLRELMFNGPGYREPQKIKWDNFLKDVKTSLEKCITKWADRESVDVQLLMEWYNKVVLDVSEAIKQLKKKKRKKTNKMTLSSPSLSKHLKDLQKEFVFVPTDKAGNNISVVCKKFYVEQSMKELDIFFNSSTKDEAKKTYVVVKEDVSSLISRHRRYMKANSIEDAEDLPYLYWIPKMHKKPFSKQRYIAASAHCSTKPLSAVLTKCLKVIENQHRIIGKRYFTNHGVNPFWIADNSDVVHSMVADLNRKKKVSSIRTYDFSTLYTNIPHKQLKSRLAQVIKKAFDVSNNSFISIYKNDARWTNSPRKKTLALDCRKIIRLLNWLIDNIYVTFGDKVFRQKIGIPMGTDCAPFLANLFLYSYESEWIIEQQKLNNYSLIHAFKHSCRYIDDLLLANNYDIMIEKMGEIYPVELVLVPDDSDGLSTSFLDLNLVIKDGVVSTSIFDKRDEFDFKIVNFPNLSGNIPLKSSYGVFICEAVRYARACTYFKDFASRMSLLVAKLKKQYFSETLLKKTYLKFCDSHVLLIQKYGSLVLELHKFW